MILMIDDDKGYCMVFQRQVERLDRDESVNAFECAQQAFDFLKSLKEECQEMPSRIFVDLEMPGMDGWMFIEALEGMNCSCLDEIELYILSSHQEMEYIKRARSYNLVKDYLIKPLRMDTLNRILNNGYPAQSPSLF